MTDLDGHYAEDAFTLFDQALEESCTPAHQYVAKLFGGGNMFPDSCVSTTDVGSRNIEAARRELAERGMHPVVEHVGGAGHRKLVFDLTSGDVWLAFSNLERAEEALSAR